MKEYRMDRTVFAMQTFKESDDKRAYWLTRTPTERLQAAFYLNSVAYNFDLHNPPKMDRTVFAMGKLDDR